MGKTRRLSFVILWCEDTAKRVLRLMLGQHQMDQAYVENLLIQNEVYRSFFNCVALQQAAPLQQVPPAFPFPMPFTGMAMPFAGMDAIQSPYFGAALPDLRAQMDLSGSLPVYIRELREIVNEHWDKSYPI